MSHYKLLKIRTLIAHFFKCQGLSLVPNQPWVAGPVLAQSALVYEACFGLPLLHGLLAGSLDNEESAMSATVCSTQSFL